MSNDNGSKLVGFAELKNLILSSNFFLRKNIHKVMWTSKGGKMKSQIDLIINTKRRRMENKHKKNVRRFRGVDGDTYHYLVI